MLHYFKTAAIAAVVAISAVIASGSAQAATVSGAMTFAGTFSYGDDIAIGDEITFLAVYPEIVGATGTFASLESDSFSNGGQTTALLETGTSNNAIIFSYAMAGYSDTLTFSIQNVTVADIRGDDSRAISLLGTLLITDSSGTYEDTLAQFSFGGTASDVASESIFSLNVSVPQVPVPAALPLLAGGLGALGAVRRRRKATKA